jgi:hypothetical protein
VVAIEDTSGRRAARHAVQSLHQAVRTLRQHILHPRLGAAAIQLCVAAVRAATTREPLHLQLQDGVVAANGEAVLPFAGGDVPFGALADAGIGELVLAAGIGADAVERLVHLLADASLGEGDGDIGECLRSADLPGVQFRAATSSDAVSPDESLRGDWWMLPRPSPTAALQPLIEADGCANLPAVAAQLLLADLDAAEAPRPPVGHLLDPLLAALLQRGDGASAAWLLERAFGHPDVPPVVAEQLRARATAACRGAWLAEQVRDPDRVQGLVALAMQLGDAELQNLADVAAAAAAELPAWLRELLPRAPDRA